MSKLRFEIDLEANKEEMVYSKDYNIFLKYRSKKLIETGYKNGSICLDHCFEYHNTFTGTFFIRERDGKIFKPTTTYEAY